MSNTHAGYSLAKQVKEFASWLGQAPGWIQIPDSYFESLEEMATTAAKTIGLEVPEYEDEDNNVIDMVCSWFDEQY